MVYLLGETHVGKRARFVQQKVEAMLKEYLHDYLSSWEFQNQFELGCNKPENPLYMVLWDGIQ